LLQENKKYQLTKFALKFEFRFI